MPETWDPLYCSEVRVNAKEAFCLYFDKDVLNVLVAETNRYVLQKRQLGWHDLSKEELEAFIGMLILMSVNPMPHTYLYWSSDKFFNLEEISKVMTSKRFQAILNSLHITDISKLKKSGEEGHDRLGKVHPFVDALNERFKQHYIPSSHQAVDESMIPFKVR